MPSLSLQNERATSDQPSPETTCHIVKKAMEKEPKDSGDLSPRVSVATTAKIVVASSSNIRLYDTGINEATRALRMRRSDLI